MTNNAPTIVIVACEASGDNYGAMLAQELLAKNPDTKLIGIGGPKMVAAGVDVRINMIENSVVGIVEVLTSIGFFMNAMSTVVEMATKERADAAILIDSPDFNLRIAPKLKAAGIKVGYFVSPQLWIWRSGRIKQIQRHVDEMMCIFPFEEGWYRERGVTAHYVGHPLMDILDFEEIENAGTDLRRATLAGVDGPLVGILPGSRRIEVTRLLPRFLKAARIIQEAYPQARFVVACSHWLNPERARKMTADFTDLDLRLEHGNTHAVIAASDFLLCASGTATFEAALIGTPMVMAYHLKWPSFLLFKTFYFNQDTLFAMPNIILGKRIVPEQIQRQAAPAIIAAKALEIYRNGGKEQLAAFAKIRKMVGAGGCGKKAAQRVLAMIG